MVYQFPKVILGKTGLSVTRLGIGGAYCKTPEGYQAALDCGINYIDTARIYQDGEDEKIIGQAIKGRRNNLILATKTTNRTADGARSELETSLNLLGTDYIDIYQLHHLNTQPEREQALGKGGAIEAVLKARDEGLIRFIGVTGHDWVQVHVAVATGLFDTVLCWYNCAMREPESILFPETQKRNMGVIVMNASRNERLFGGSDAPAPEQFYRYVLNHKAVNLTIMGLKDVDRFCKIASAISERVILTPQEKAELEDYGSKMRAHIG